MENKYIRLKLLILSWFIFFTQGCVPSYDINHENDKEIRNIINEFKPYEIGNPLGNDENNLMDKRYFNQNTRWWCTLITSGISVICLYILWICHKKLHLFKEKTSRQNNIKTKIIKYHYILFSSFFTLLLAGLGYGIGCGLEAYYGGPFDYAAYSIPEEPVDIVFWFSGADEGACGHKDFGTHCDYCYAATEFGYEHVAMFNFSDVDEALEYARKLPDGTRLIIRGHSTGASSAIRFVHKLPANIKVLLLDTRDPISWLGRNKEKPSNVLYWRNVLPGDAHVIGKKDQHEGTKFIGRINCANLDMVIGGPWGICHGATNIILQGKDHHEVGRNIDK